MMLIFTLATRNAVRNVTRTLLTALTVFLGTALLTISLAWMDGVFGEMLTTAANQTGHVRVVDPAFVQREELFPLYENLDLKEMMPILEGAPGVKEVVPRITTGVGVSVGDTMGDVFSLAIGAPPSWLDGRLGFADNMASGRNLSGKSGEFVLGATLANRVGAGVGDEIVLLGQTQDGSISPIKGTVVGVVGASNGLIDQSAFVPLEDMMYLADMDGYVTELLIYGDSRDSADQLKASLDKLDLKGATVQAWSSREPWVGLLPIIGLIRGVLNTVIVFITALGVWNTMMMSVMERTGEIGVLRAMGLGKLGAVMLFVVEALMISVIGGISGVAFGGAVGMWLEVRGVELGEKLTQNLDAAMPVQTTVYADMSPTVAIWALSLGILMAILGSALPAIRAANIQPVEAMRTRR